MDIQFLMLATVLFSAGMLQTSAGWVNESDFVYVSHMPAIEGRLADTYEFHDARSGLAVRKDIRVVEGAGFARWTYVVIAGCARLPADPEPFIVAHQYRPAEPKTYSMAVLAGFWAEVYVRDLAGRIRLYQGLDARAMAALTRKYQPPCTRL
jgi:hypothetical protein